MSLHPHTLPPVPDATAAAVEAAFPRGNLYVDLRAEFGSLYTDELFADLYPPSGRPVEILPWRLALVLVMQYIEGLTDRQAADAVRRCLDWKYALSLEIPDPGFDFTLLHDFRVRLLQHAAGQRLLDTFLLASKARGLIKARGMQRTDSTHVLAAVRSLHHLECITETLHAALNQLSAADPDWIHAHIPSDWFAWYGLRAEQSRFPKDATKRVALAETMGTHGYHLFAWVTAPTAPPHLRTLPAVEVLRQVWLQQFYRCTMPGAEELHWRTLEDTPPAAQRIQSPYDLEARYSSKRDTHWVGYKVHVSETCDPDRPDLITQVITTPATTQDSLMGPTIQQDLADRDLLPGVHLLDTGYVDSELLVTGATRHQIDVVGPPVGSYSHQRRAGEGFDLHTFVINWEAETVRCPAGQTSVKWTPGVDVSGDPVVRIRFARETCRVCPVRAVCTRAKESPRQLTMRPKAQHEAIARARQRQETNDFKAQYALRAGVESTISQGVRRFEMRQSRYIGLARSHLQQLLVAVAMNLVRVIGWLWNETGAETPRALGQFARLSPRPVARRTLIC